MSINFIDNSQTFIGAYPKAIQKALAAIATTAEGYAKKETPVDTGRLRNSIANAVSGDAAYIGTNVEYGPYVELGTRNMEGYHMIQQACQNHSEKYKAIAEAALKSY